MPEERQCRVCGQWYPIGGHNGNFTTLSSGKKEWSCNDCLKTYDEQYSKGGSSATQAWLNSMRQDWDYVPYKPNPDRKV